MLARKLLTGLTLAAGPLAAQTPSIADSVAALERAGKWEAAARLIDPGLAAARTTEERCALLFDGLLAGTRLWRYAGAPRQLRAFDDECAASKVATIEARRIADLRQELDLPPMPVEPVDWTAVDQFWMAVDTLSRGIEPSRAQWRALVTSPGYRIAMLSHSDLPRLIDIAFNPARRSERDSILSRPSSDSGTIDHLLSAAAARDTLRQYRAAIEPTIGDTIAAAIRSAARFLPDAATDHTAPPLVTFTLFAADGYSQQPGIVLDLYHVRETGLTTFLSHEFHHSFASAFDRTRPPPGAPDLRLYLAIRQLRGEGIADMIDKPFPLREPPDMQWYADSYNAAYERTPGMLHTLDSLLVVAGAHPEAVADIGQRAQRMLIYGSHPNGAYMARTILETFGRDSLVAGVYSPFHYIRTFIAAQKERGEPPSFTAAGIAVLDDMEKRYAR